MFNKLTAIVTEPLSKDGAAILSDALERCGANKVPGYTNRYGPARPRLIVNESMKLYYYIALPNTVKDPVDFETMLRSLEREALMYFAETHKAGAQCPICFEEFRPNGTGPTNKPWLKKILEKMPYDKEVTRPAACCHDWHYHWGEHEDNLTREEADHKFLEDMRELVIQVTEIEKPAPKSRKFWKRWLQNIARAAHISKQKTRRLYLMRIVNLYYSAVVIGGKSSYDQNGCTIEGGVE